MKVLFLHLRMKIPRDGQERNGAKCINNFRSKFCKMIVLQNVHNNNKTTSTTTTHQQQNNNNPAITKQLLSRATKTFDLNKNHNYKNVLISVSQPVFQGTQRFLEYLRDQRYFFLIRVID